MMIQSRYWRCMYPKGPQEQGLWTDRLHGKPSQDQISGTVLTVYRCHSCLSIEAAVRQFQTHLAIHLSDIDLEVVRESSPGEVSRSILK
jgi:hypothetical protein